MRLTDHAAIYINSLYVGLLKETLKSVVDPSSSLEKVPN